jgi:hypothetical protein
MQKENTMATYKPPAYDESKYRKGINTSYYDNAIKTYTQQANTDRANQLGDAQKTQQANLRQAYVNRLQNERTLQNNLAQSGIRGGATETANLRLANTYGQARAAANADYANSVTSINRAIDQNIADYTSDMNSRAEEYRQNLAQAKWQADRETAQARWQAAREDAANKYERTQAEKNRLTEYWSNYYINKYSGYSKKQLTKAEKDIKANLAKAKTAGEKIRWQQALSGIGARRGVIATSK